MIDGMVTTPCCIKDRPDGVGSINSARGMFGMESLPYD